LPKPYYEYKVITIYCDNCFEIMKHISDEAVNLVLANLSYNISLNYNNATNNRKSDYSENPDKKRKVFFAS